MLACRALRRFPSRNATVNPTGKRLTANGIGRQSTIEIAAPSSQYAVGAAKGKRRRAKIGSTRIAIAGRANHSERAESGESRPITTSSAAAIARSAISASNQYLRATYLIRL